MEQRLLIILLAFGLCNCAKANEQPPPPKERDQFVAKAEDAVRWRLKDPESARFNWFNVFPEEGVACGFVNAKNSFGGYSGRAGVAYDKGSVAIEGDGKKYLDATRRCISLTEAATTESKVRAMTDIEELRKLDPKAAAELEKELEASDRGQSTLTF